MDVTIISPVDYMLYTPLLPDVAGAVVDARFVTVPADWKLAGSGKVAGTVRFDAGRIAFEKVAGELTALKFAGAGLTIDEPQVKLSAAWLIQHAGVQRGFRLPGSDAHISTKHTLAIVNGGSATAAQVLELARYVQQRVRNEFGVVLHPDGAMAGA